MGVLVGVVWGREWVIHEGRMGACPDDGKEIAAYVRSVTGDTRTAP
jgi:hypothetical protein